MGRRKKGDTTTRDKILTTARKMFSEKGYDATSVDQIVKAAEINKSSVYYYFDSKKAILENIYKEFSDKALEIKKSFPLGGKISREDIERSIEFNRRNSDVVKIMWMEMVKSSNETPAFLKYFDQGFIDGKRIADEANVELEDTRKNRIMVMFMATFPIWGYTALGEQICSYYKWDKEGFTKDFIDVFYDLYVKNLQNSFGIEE
ncbi:MAG: TetR/AcrR family transcriptional regulator [Spirochaetales bacterium]|nr:TetR/AcrR family transcriptional regulator [Spirochaetales bacterium]